jgi:PAS domain S-box-containing protein
MADMNNHDFDFFSFFDRSPDLVFIAGKDGFFRKLNPTAIEKFGYTTDELFSNPISTFIYSEDKELTRKEREKLLSGESLHNFQNRYLTKKGDILWLEWTSIYFPDREFVLAIAKDITARKKIEREIEEKYKKFKSLATHFKTNIEENRKYLAVELHDELAQLATVVKMDMDWIGMNEPGLSDSSTSRLEHARVVVDLLINTIRRISFSVSPKMLDDLGLNATLEWHCKEFELLNGIPCTFVSNCAEDSLTSELKLDFFRICQEALTNTMYHASASTVSIHLEETWENFSLTVTDDGVGFNTDQQQTTSGIDSMRERASSVNGYLEINSHLGMGTKVCVTIPK